MFLSAQGVEFERLKIVGTDYRNGGISAGDFNNDGKADLVEMSESELLVRRGNGDGTFQEPVRTSLAAHLYYFTTADFNNDGNLDVAAVDEQGDPFLHLFLGDGGGGFTALVPQRIPSKNPPTQWTWIDIIRAADMNGDGKPDLVLQILTYWFDSEGPLYVLLGRGDGTFDTLPAVEASAYAFELLDADRDAITDMAVWSSGGRLSILLGNGDGTFRDGPPLPPEIATDGIATGDFDRDGIPDLAISGGGVIRILAGSGDGSFRQAKVFPSAPSAALRPARDWNGDGILDFLIGLYANDKRLLLLTGAENPNFNDALEVNKAHWILDIADFDGDGRPDLLLPDPGGVAELLLNRTRRD
jgi:hypothetical protein